MRVMFWNVRGLGKAYRRKMVHNHILQENLGIIALQESIKQDFSRPELKDMEGNKEF